MFGGSWTEERIPHYQDLDAEGLAGRIRSCSYVPAAGEPGFQAMMTAANRLFEQHAQEGLFRLRYDTVVQYRRPLEDAPISS